MADTKQLLQQAIAAARMGLNPQAKVLADRVLKKEPDNVNALLLMGALTDDTDEQVGYLNQVLAIDPDNQVARDRLAQLTEPEAVEAPAEIPGPAEMTVVAAMAAEGPAAEGPAAEGPAAEGPAAEGPAAEGPAFEEMALEEPASEEPAADDMSLFAEWLDLDEEPAGEGLDEAFFAAVVAPTPEAIELSDEEIDATMIQPIEERFDMAAGEVDDTMIQAVAATKDLSFDEQAEASTIPSWLSDEGGLIEGSETVKPLPDQTVKAAELGELPDWLMEGPEEDWIEPDETEVPAESLAAAVREQPRAETAAAPAAAKPPARRKKKRSRAPEILLAILIILAVVIVVALVYLLLNPV